MLHQVSCTADASFIGLPQQYGEQYQIWRYRATASEDEKELFCTLPPSWPSLIRYSDHAETLIVVMGCTSVLLYDIRNGKLTGQLSIKHGDNLGAVEISEDRLYVITGARLAVHDIKTGDLLVSLKVHTDWTHSWLTTLPDHTVLLWYDSWYSSDHSKLTCQRITLSRTTSRKRGHCYRLYTEDVPLRVPQYSELTKRSPVYEILRHPTKPNILLILEYRLFPPEKSEYVITHVV
jgi:hypothetical protein